MSNDSNRMNQVNHERHDDSNTGAVAVAAQDDFVTVSVIGGDINKDEKEDPIDDIQHIDDFEANDSRINHNDNTHHKINDNDKNTTDDDDDDEDDDEFDENNVSSKFLGVDAEMNNNNNDDDDELEEDDNDNNITTKLEVARELCCPHGIVGNYRIIPLVLTFSAFLCTAIGSYDCSFFKGATISFLGGMYGLWTVQDTTGKCQLWDVLFFSYKLGGPLIAARVFSMTIMLLGMGLLTTMTQALRFHAASWLIGGLFLLLFLLSLSTTSIFNMWVVFWSFTYVIFILIVRYLFVHPIHRQISVRGSKIISGVLLLCSILSILTLVVLKSDFCTCANITSPSLQDRDVGEPCNGICQLHVAGYVMIVASIFWLLAAGAVLRFGIQPDGAVIHSTHEFAQQFDHYPNQSITTRTANAIKRNKKRVKKVVAKTPPLKRYVTPSESDRAALLREPDPRSYCSKICCDFRVTQRTRNEKVSFWCFRIALGIIVFIWGFIVVVKTGSRIENTEAGAAPSTSYNFVTPKVCAYNASDPTQPFQTFDNKAAAKIRGLDVAHCGACGYCSNPYDIRKYVETRKTVAKSAKQCGSKSVFGGYNALVTCLEEKIEFSRDCTVCWAENMVNTRKNCLFTCMTTLFTGFMSSNNVAGAGDRGWLNQCLFCDEKLSGPAFVTCSGVARRRLGIPSEIERNPNELCKRNDVDWLNVNWDSEFPTSNDKLVT